MTLSLGKVSTCKRFSLLVHFKDWMSDDDRELINRYIVQKQFEIIQNKDRENWHEENEEDFSAEN